MNDAEIRSLAKRLAMPKIMWDTEAFRAHLIELAHHVESAERERSMNNDLNDPTSAGDNLDGKIPGEGALFRIPITVDVTMTALVMARGRTQEEATETARRFASEGGARFTVDEGNYRSLLEYYVDDPRSCKSAEPIDIESLAIGSIIVSTFGEIATVDDLGEVETEPDARGYIASILPRQDMCFSVVFPASGVWVFLSKAEICSGDYRVEGRLSDGDVVGKTKNDDGEDTVLRWNGRDAVDSGEPVVDFEGAAGLTARDLEWLSLDENAMPSQDPVDAENDVHAQRVLRHGC